MGQLVVLGQYSFDADKVLLIGPAGGGLDKPPDMSKILIHLDMGEWTATIQFDGKLHSLKDIQETVRGSRTVDGPAKVGQFVSPEYRSAIDKLGKVIDHKISLIKLTADEARSVLDVCLQVTPEV